MIELDEKMKKGICGNLIEYDPEIVEVVQFGSSIYAPEYAMDLDLLVITKNKKGYGGYLDCLDDLNLYFGVDVVVKERGERLKGDFACQIFGSFEVLYGDGRCLSEMVKNFDPSFEEARSHLHVDYFYNGNYPENYEEAFKRWYKRVEDFVNRLEGEKK
jgi:hypothetical protein